MIPAYLSPLANHLWQSTLFAAVAGLLTIALRKNRASVRYWLWLAGSVKFLVPFSLLVNLGSQFAWQAAPSAEPIQFSAVMDQISQPFASPPSPLLMANEHGVSTNGPTVLFCVWLFGFLLVAFSWTLQWRRMRAAVRSASPMDLHLPIKVMSSPARLEPGVFGIIRPVLVVPQGIMEHLTPAQWEMILVHELCHARRRDNLTAAIQMAIEAVFWFHPLVWWIGLRLVDERERACDEEVLLVASDPHVYAEGILNICKIYLESPLLCVSGVSGSNLKKRIRGIMTRRVADKLDFGRKLLLAAAGIVAIGGPIVFGLANAAQGKAQSKSEGGSSVTFEVASVRPSDTKAGDAGGFKTESGKTRGPAFQVDHRRFSATNLNLFGLILKAYGVTGCRPLGGGNCVFLSGGPDWIRKDGFDIVAKMPDASPDYTLMQLQNGHASQLQLMLQALLTDRFHLKLHRETRQAPVYALTLGKNGPKFEKAAESEEPKVMFRPLVESNGQQMIQLVVQNSSMLELAELYTKFMDRPVLDRTGLKDRYDFTMDYEANADAPGPFAAATGPALFRALQEKGLKLEATKGAVEVLVIDHAEHPSEN